MVYGDMVVHKTVKDFKKYLIVGLLATFANIFFMWLLIDIFRIPTIIGSTIVVVSIFFGKFYAYVLIGLILHQFLKYASINIGSGLLNIFFVWLFIDIFGVPTVISSAVVVYSLFLLRFAVFKITKLIK